MNPCLFFRSALCMGISQLYRLIGQVFFGRTVDGEDQVDRLAPFINVDGGSGTGFDCADHICNLPRVSVERDGRQRGGRTERGGLHDDVLMAAGINVPLGNGIFLQRDRAFFAVDLQPARIAGIDRGCRLNHADGAAFKVDHRAERVLHLDFAGPAFWRVRIRGKPDGEMEQQIDAVDALVHQRAAAVEPLGAPPASAVVIFLRAEVLHIDVCRYDAAEQSLVDGILCPHQRAREA